MPRIAQHRHRLADLVHLLQVVRDKQERHAFALQLGRTYNAWLARAFPQLPEHVLIDATARLREVRLQRGESERVTHGAASMYIVTRGRGLLLRDGPGGHDILLRVLGPGEIVSNEGTLVLAETTLELLALPNPAA